MKGIAFYGEDFFRIKEEKDLIEENITRILLTSSGTRVMSNFGSNLKNFIFQQESVLRSEIKSEISTSITRWEPRVIVNDVIIEEVEREKVYIKLDLTIRETLEPFTYETIIRL